jgi:hypothetical protein
MLAHAYLFDGQIDKARAIYREAQAAGTQERPLTELLSALVRKDTEPTNLADIVLADFKLLRRTGLDHPEMAAIETCCAALPGLQRGRAMGHRTTKMGCHFLPRRLKCCREAADGLLAWAYSRSCGERPLSALASGRLSGPFPCRGLR